MKTWGWELLGEGPDFESQVGALGGILSGICSIECNPMGSPCYDCSQMTARFGSPMCEQRSHTKGISAHRSDLLQHQVTLTQPPHWCMGWAGSQTMSHGVPALQMITPTSWYQINPVAVALANSGTAEPAGLVDFYLSIIRQGINLSHVSFKSTIPSAKLSGV